MAAQDVLVKKVEALESGRIIMDYFKVSEAINTFGPYDVIDSDLCVEEGQTIEIVAQLTMKGKDKPVQLLVEKTDADSLLPQQVAKAGDYVSSNGTKFTNASASIIYRDTTKSDAQYRVVVDSLDNKMIEANYL